MDAWVAALLGFVQGVTEFLPVSSSGHLVLVQALLDIHEEGILFEVAVHVATLVAVLVFYRRRVLDLAGGALRGSPEALRYIGKLALATVPAVLAVLAFEEAFERLYDIPMAVGGALLVTGLLLITTVRTIRGATGLEPSWLAALLIGCAQAMAITPGISRSGATVAAALALGVAPAAAAEFSFLMSVIAILGATVLQLPDFTTVSGAGWVALASGGIVALVSGLASLWLFVRLLQTQVFHRFAYYTWIAGTAVIVWQLTST